MYLEKPDDEKIKNTLSPLSYEVTQNAATEPPFNNKYNDFFEEGIYVDIITGEPLFSSKTNSPAPAAGLAFISL